MIRFVAAVLAFFLVLGCPSARLSRKEADSLLAHVRDADSHFVDYQEDSLILPAVDFYRRRGPSGKYAWSLYYLGRLRFNAKDYNGAILAYAQAAETRLFRSDPEFRGFVRSAIGDTYGLSYYDEEALQNDSLALADFRQTGNAYYETGALYDLALQHYNMHHWDTADSLYEQLVPVPYPWISQLSKKGRASIALYRPDPDPAASVRLFEELAASGFDFTSRDIGEWAYACELTGQRERADSLLGILDLSGDLARYGYMVADVRGETEEALRYLVETEAYNDSLHTALQRHSVQTSMEQYQAQAAREARDRAKIRKLVIFLLIVLLASLIFLSEWLLQRQRRLHAERERRLEFIAGEAQRLRRLAEDRQRTLQAEKEEGMRRFVASFRREWQTLADLCHEYHVTYADPQARNLIYNKVMDLASKIGRDDKSFHALEKRINDELDGLMHDFRRDFGDRLTETKYRLAACLVAGFDPPLIALLFGWKDLQMVYREKNRLMDKVRLSRTREKDRYLIALK